MRKATEEGNDNEVAQELCHYMFTTIGLMNVKYNFSFYAPNYFNGGLSFIPRCGRSMGLK